MRGSFGNDLTDSMHEKAIRWQFEILPTASRHERLGWPSRSLRRVMSWMVKTRLPGSSFVNIPSSVAKDTENILRIWDMQRSLEELQIAIRWPATWVVYYEYQGSNCLCISARAISETRHLGLCTYVHGTSMSYRAVEVPSLRRRGIHARLQNQQEAYPASPLLKAWLGMSPRS